MAKKISQLTQATEVKSDDVTVIVQDGETKKLPLNMMVTKQDIENKKVAGLAKLDEIEATYENDTYTPTIAVKNKSSVKVGEGDGVDYSANVMDGHVKSAILKGQTLVNLYQSKTVRFLGEEKFNVNKDKLIENNKYTLFYEVKENKDNKVIFVDHMQSNKLHTNNSYYIESSIGSHKELLTFKKQENYKTNFNWWSDSSQTISIDNIILLEGDHTQEDIPYFDGMQSVKMPVLTTIGKNLVDDTILKIANLSEVNVTDKAPIKVEPNKSYFVGLTLQDGREASTNWFTIEYKDENGIVVTTNYHNHVVSFTEEQAQKIKTINVFTNKQHGYSSVFVEHLWVVESSETVPYEPYKTNILTVNEEVELRGIGDVQDELNLLSGELVQRFHKTTIDENYSWTLYGENNGYLQFGTALTVKGNVEGELKGASNGLPYGTLSGEGSQEQVLVFEHENWITQLRIMINPSRLETPDVEGFIKYITNNPFELIYAQQPTAKTVDLMPSGTHPSTTPYCWKNGHIQLSSSGLLPNLEYSVVTSRAGQINQNATMIVKNDKRIFDLEILLAGGLVNTTYQALTLQNQVETGLSKVSLNSETEPDYLLYHMIMKLIEEKAYKLDDLTEKVSVFYLYEKLSDEQFETIYSALYPFVEDEIVEEPVVEELPEVVEDEVIM